MTARAVPPSPLTPLEIASGVVVGADPGTPPLPAYDGRSPREALEAAVLPALQRAPCLVAFSGGRDSSAVLALAAHVARRGGLPLPVPVTIRFPAEPETEEDDWQERVVRHLHLDDWHRESVTDELDIIGPFAKDALRRHGVPYPFNGYTYTPMFARAAGGTLMTGLDGDGLLAGWMAESAVDVIAWRRPPRPRDVLRVGLYAGPRAVRRQVWARRLRPAQTWLTPDAERRTRRAEAAEMAEEPLRWDARVSWWNARRYLRLSEHFDDVLGAAAGVRMSHPLMDPAFLASLAHTGGRYGPGNRTAVMRHLLSDLLPDDVLARAGKAYFNSAFFNRHSREFAQRWDGASVDRALVDPGRLRAAWLSPRPPLGTAMLLQSTWLTAEGTAG